MAVRKLDKFINDIVNKLFPALRESSMNLIMYNDPVYSSTTVNTYAGDLDDDRVRLEISSNHVELKDYVDDNAVFATIYYKGKGTKVGVLNLDDINECVGLIYATLYELGYRTKDDLEKEQKEKEEKKKAEEEKKKAEAQRKREERKVRQQAELVAQEDNEEPEEEFSPEEESKNSINEASKDFDLYLEKLQNINDTKSLMMANISFSNGENSFKVINVDMNYIDKETCLVITTGIKPRVKQEVTWDRAKNYLIKVTEKVTGIISIGASDPNGKDINIDDLKDDSDNVDLDINI